MKLGGLASLRQRSLPAKATLLVGIMVALYAAAAPVAYHFAAGTGVVAASVAAAICLVPSLTALTISSVLRGPQNALAGLLLAMFARTGVPLLLALLIFRRGPLADAGAIYYLIVFYLVALGLETWLSLPASGATPEQAGTR